MALRCWRAACSIAILGALFAVPLRAQEAVSIPSPNGTMAGLLYRPSGQPPFPVVVFSHGRAVGADERQAVRRPLPDHAVRFWTARGAAVVVPIRPGYGATGGADVEDNGNRNCQTVPNFARTAESAAVAIAATVTWAREQPWARRDRLLLVGQSVGGLGTVAAAARGLPGVTAYVNFAGGSGGNPRRSPGASCHPEALQTLFARYASSVPGLWFYAANDNYWGAAAPRAWAAAYRAAGGRAEFVFTGPTGSGDGHLLLRSSPELYRNALSQFAGRHGF